MTPFPVSMPLLTVSFRTYLVIMLGHERRQTNVPSAKRPNYLPNDPLVRQATPFDDRQMTPSSILVTVLSVSLEFVDWNG